MSVGGRNIQNRSEEEGYSKWVRGAETLGVVGSGEILKADRGHIRDPYLFSATSINMCCNIFHLATLVSLRAPHTHSSHLSTLHFSYFLSSSDLLQFPYLIPATPNSSLISRSRSFSVALSLFCSLSRLLSATDSRLIIFTWSFPNDTFRFSIRSFAVISLGSSSVSE